MLEKSYYEKADEIIAHYGPKPSSLIPSCRIFRKLSAICPVNC